MEEIEKLKLGGMLDPGSPGRFESIRLPNKLPATAQIGGGGSTGGEI
jgi:hypothetical protein